MTIGHENLVILNGYRHIIILNTPKLCNEILDNKQF